MFADLFKIWHQSVMRYTILLSVFLKHSVFNKKEGFQNMNDTLQTRIRSQSLPRILKRWKQSSRSLLWQIKTLRYFRLMMAIEVSIQDSVPADLVGLNVTNRAGLFAFPTMWWGGKEKETFTPIGSKTSFVKIELKGWYQYIIRADYEPDEENVTF